MSLDALTRECRDLPIALAHYFARSKPGDANLEMLNRLYMEMNPRDKLRCQAALHVVRAARRGERVAS